MLNASQSIAASYRYDPFGNLISKSGSLADANVYRFSSKECHSNSVMYYFGYRFYDPNLQRWINRDPFWEYGFQQLFPVDTARPGRSLDGNLFVFVRNYAENEMDPWGLQPTFKGCTSKQIDQINKGLKDDCDKAKNCAKKCRSEPDKAGDGVDKVCNQSPTINCVDRDFSVAKGYDCSSNCGLGRGGEIFLCPSAFKDPKGCGRPSCTILHEGLHFGGVGKPGQKHPMDFSDFENCMGCPPKGGL
jgi:RHS repeat-associated protein